MIGTQVFDDFLADNDLSEQAMAEGSDAEAVAAFLAGRLRPAIEADLRAFVDRIRDPIAVRSSSLLEDSYDQPFAGIYCTTMLANNDADLEVRYQDLAQAVKLVFASSYFQNAKAYLQNTQNRMEEQKMAVVLQKLVGQRHGSYFDPTSPGSPARRTTTRCRYEPPGSRARRPRPREDGRRWRAGGALEPGPAAQLQQLEDTPESTLENAQRQFYALDLDRRPDADSLAIDPDSAVVRLDLDQAERDAPSPSSDRPLTG